MGLQQVVWCDVCNERQFGGTAAFELTIAHRQILPRLEHKRTERTVILCGFFNVLRMNK